MYTAQVHYGDYTKPIPFDSYEINSAGTVIIFLRRGYGDVLLPLFNVHWIEMGQ